MAEKKANQTKSSIPVSKEELVTLKIEQIGSEGEGIGKYEGYTLFVKDAVVGDTILAKVLKTKKTYGYARLQEILEASPYRVTPVCPVARQCGGCQIQQLSYEQQLIYKQQKVLDCVTRIGGFEGIVGPEVNASKNDEGQILMESVVGMEDPYYYRNKSQFPVGKSREGKIVTGFYAGRTHSIIENETCYIGAAINEQILSLIKAFMEEYQIAPYDEQRHTGLVRHVLTRVGFTTGEVMVCLVINGKQLPHQEVLVERLKAVKQPVTHPTEGIQSAGEQFVQSICLNVNKEKTNVILGDKVIPLYGEPYITDYIGPIQYRISPLSFYQVNPVQTKKLYELALEYADLTGEETVWDLYCGIGTISLFLAQKAQKVYGVEIIPQAIEDAKENARLNQIENAEFFVGAAEDVLPEQYKKYGVHADVIVVDPPRKGCDEKLLDTIVQMAPKRVVYVSCDPATLARDAKYLCEHGYELVKFRAVDQFAHSVHVETVCLLSKLHEAKHHINVKVDMDELDLTSAEAKATYKEIEEWVQEHYGFHVTNLNIAQVKQKHGIIERENYNKPKSENSRQPGCPEEKVKAIEEALKFFQMI